jgi:hypothetical protein
MYEDAELVRGRKKKINSKEEGNYFIFLGKFLIHTFFG